MSLLRRGKSLPPVCEMASSSAKRGRPKKAYACAARGGAQTSLKKRRTSGFPGGGIAKDMNQPVFAGIKSGDAIRRRRWRDAGRGVAAG